MSAFRFYVITISNGRLNRGYHSSNTGMRVREPFHPSKEILQYVAKYGFGAAKYSGSIKRNEKESKTIFVHIQRLMTLQ